MQPAREEANTENTPKSSVGYHNEEESLFDLPLFLKESTVAQESPTESDLIRKSRAKAWNRFVETGFPTREDEAFRYTRFLNRLREAPLAPLLAAEGDRSLIESSTFPECRESWLIFYNGYFRTNLSSMRGLGGVIIQPFSQASRTFHSLMSGSWSRLLKDETDPLAFINLAAFHDGVFIYVPPEKKIQAPLHVLSITSDVDADSWVMPRLHVLLGHHAELTIVETVVSHADRHLLYSNSHTVFELEDSAILHHAHVAFDTPGVQAIHTDAVRAYLKDNAQLTSTSYVAPAYASRRSYSVWLKGQNAQAALNGSWMTAQEQEAHSHVHIQHDEPHCRSMQRFKGVVQDSSRSSFEGKIYVSQKAQKTEAYQLNNNLVLGDDARAYSKPNLEIFADDVKASHGATTGQLDEESLFYLQTRGLSKNTARRCLIEGFLSEVASNIDVESLHDRVIERIHSFCS